MKYRQNCSKSITVVFFYDKCHINRFKGRSGLGNSTLLKIGVDGTSRIWANGWVELWVEHFPRPSMASPISISYSSEELFNLAV